MHAIKVTEIIRNKQNEFLINIVKQGIVQKLI